MKINPVYLAMVIGLVVLVPLAREIQQRATEFYGIAEDQDVDISLEYPALLRQLLIKEGEEVEAAQVLAILQRTELPFQRASLEQEKIRLQADRQSQILERKATERELQQEKELALFEIDNRILQLEAEQALKSKLATDLQSIPTPQADKTLEPELVALRAERTEITKPYDVQLNTLSNDAQALLKSIDARLTGVDLELEELSRQQAELELKAPRSGVVGRIHFVPGEQVAARDPILNIYIEHPSQITTYIPEGQLTSIELGDSLRIRTLNADEYLLTAVVAGLGTKIRELPVRMRRDPTVQAWGRELRLQIPLNNTLMQGERVLVVQEE
jgi:multidrug resistance efflux pump